ncbi:MAG: SDR family NAD(P)-dependent oxidoreductase [bacterium]
MRLAGKVALITGAGRGIGRAVAEAFALEGARVVLNARDATALKEVARNLRSCGQICLEAPGDITVAADRHRLVAESLRRFKRLDVLVNCAALLGPRVSVTDYPEDEWRSVMETNFFGLLGLVKEVIPAMQSSGNGGSIIAVSSSVGRHGRAGWGAYAVSKFAVEGLVQVMAEELRPHKIRINSVNPGGTRTDMRREAYPDEDPMTLPPPEAIVPVFLHLASDESMDMTGQALDARQYFDLDEANKKEN